MIELTRPLVALDLETTGINPNRDRIVQIGIVKLKPNGETKEWESLVNPGIPIPPHVVETHGITDTMVKDELPFSRLGPMLIKGIEGCDLCGHNVMFDVNFLRTEFKRIGIKWTPGCIVDSLKIFQIKEPRNLTAAVRYYLDEELENAHTALADARASLRVLQAQLKRYPDLPTRVEDLYELLFVKGDNKDFLDADKKLRWFDGAAVLNFGKHSGKSLRDAPKDYLQWMMNGSFSPHVKEIIKNALEGKYPIKEE